MFKSYRTSWSFSWFWKKLYIYSNTVEAHIPRWHSKSKGWHSACRLFWALATPGRRTSLASWSEWWRSGPGWSSSCSHPVGSEHAPINADYRTSVDFVFILSYRSCHIMFYKINWGLIFLVFILTPWILIKKEIQTGSALLHKLF